MRNGPRRGIAPQRYLSLAILVAGLVGAVWQAGRSGGPTSAEGAERSGSPIRPSAVCRRELMGPQPVGGEDILTAWFAPPVNVSARDANCVYDNGAPLDDEGHPASQLSDASTPSLQFIAGSADDFMIGGGTAGMNCHINTVRAAFSIFNGELPGDTPRTKFEGVYVTVYPDATGAPAGMPRQDGGQDGTFVVSRYVPASSLQNETLLSGCVALYRVDIPVDITLAKDTLYWLSLVPKFPYPPQSAWSLSQMAGGSPAKQGFPSPPPNLPFWAEVEGNRHSCQNAPPAETRKNLSFMLMGTETTQVQGACCTDGMCSEPINQANCQQPNQRFLSGGTCGQFNPPCEEAAIGGCCLPDGACQDLNPAQCGNSGGTWNATLCTSGLCMPVNGLCANALLVSNGATIFDTTGVVTDGPADAPAAGCTQVNQDIWFRYAARCTGMVTVSLCGSAFDTAISVYQGWGCIPPLLRVSCNNDFAACGAASKVSFAATANAQYLIRVGGAGTATGAGTMDIECVAGGTGACCFPDRHCEVLTEAACQAVQGTYTADQPCSPLTCGPTNDLCANAILVSSGVHAFDTRGAATDGPADSPGPPCTNVMQDVWFKYVADCTGQLTASLCSETDFNAAMAVYDGCACQPLGPQLACDNDSCGTAGGPPTVTLSVTQGQCYLIRIGGEAAATGTGQLTLTCTPPSSGCCPGDTDGNGSINENDVQGLVDALLDHPPAPATLEFCRADVNHDNSVDGLDIAELIAKVLQDTGCTGACCHTGGTCEVTTAADCMVTGDQFNPGGSCTPNPCMATATGACCKNDGLCGVLSQSACGAAGGAYHGDGTSCTPELCAPTLPPPACGGDVNGDCQVDETDIGPFVQVLLDATQQSAEKCRADANGDGLVDGRDMKPFIDNLIAQCHCCRGDTNHDGKLDGLDIQGLINAVIAQSNPLADCNRYNVSADVDNSGTIDTTDIEIFVNLLVNGAQCSSRSK